MDIMKRIMQSVDEFPTLPTIYTTLSDVMANPYSTPADAAEIISRDQSSSLKILRTANSSLYGFEGKIDSITQAIFYIGFDEVLNLILALSIIDLFKKSNLLENFNPLDLWKHSIAVGVISRIIGEHLGVKRLENYFISGIMHDIGKILFISRFEEEYARTIAYALENEVTIREAEAAVMGVTHTVAGEMIAEKWKLPPNIRFAVRNHTSGVTPGKKDKLTACVHIANITARMLRFGSSGDYTVPEPNLQAWDVLDMEENSFTSIMPKIINDFEESTTIFTLN